VKHSLQVDDPEALGLLHDYSEIYMRDLTSKVIERARTRTQDINLKQAQQGHSTTLKTVMYRQA
jgi:5'-deoxynucleotidase YfbR-like HD superfamily hydrolase